MKMLIEDIKNRQFKKIYLLTGEEVYLQEPVPEAAAGGS